MQPRIRTTALSVCLALVVLVFTAGGAQAAVLDSHPSTNITHIGGSICSVKYGHQVYNDHRTSWTDVFDLNGNCTYVRTRAYWFHDELGWYTAVGPMNGLYSSLATGGILSWGHHPVCGMTTVWYCSNRA
jgi:hypothetical protein